jgi:hypothetical protein
VVTFASFGNTLRRGLRVWLESRHGRRSTRVEACLFPPVGAPWPRCQTLTSDRRRGPICKPLKSEINRQQNRLGRFVRGRKCDVRPNRRLRSAERSQRTPFGGCGARLYLPKTSCIGEKPAAGLDDHNMAHLVGLLSYSDCTRFSVEGSRFARGLKSIARSVEVAGLAAPLAESGQRASTGSREGRPGACMGGS